MNKAKIEAMERTAEQTQERAQYWAREFEEQAALRRIVARATADVESRTTLLRERLTIATRLDEKAKAMTAEIEEFWRTDKKVSSCHALQPARAGAP